MVLHRVDRHDQILRDLPVAASGGQQTQDTLFLHGKRLNQQVRRRGKAGTICFSGLRKSSQEGLRIGTQSRLLKRWRQLTQQMSQRFPSGVQQTAAGLR